MTNAILRSIFASLMITSKKRRQPIWNHWDPCNLIGSQWWDLFTNHTVFFSKPHLFPSQWGHFTKSDFKACLKTTIKLQENGKQLLQLFTNQLNTGPKSNIWLILVSDLFTHEHELSLNVYGMANTKRNRVLIKGSIPTIHAVLSEVLEELTHRKKSQVISYFQSSFLKG